MENYLTEKQEAVYNFIEEYQMAHGKSPTIKEMREHFGVSSDNSILKHLKGLIEKGFIEKDDTPRGIKLLNVVRERLEGTSQQFKLPILGFIPAGGAVLSEEYMEGYMEVGSDIADSSKNCFLLEVTGNSMINAGIHEGDLVVVDMKREPRAEDIVVALIDGGNTLKRLVKKDGKFYLQAENPEYKDIYPANSLEVQGVVVSMIRKYY
ncbi:repressor LexA [Candidatus Peregrinibacteria bacterium HGW-Peregrinibacteria-1]|jgi:repressor LexA|nr:MAG: repressor LexA [Candidatus Peregrinibacteria bacterium HGW-Peregrinibacteria-1]